MFDLDFMCPLQKYLATDIIGMLDFTNCLPVNEQLISSITTAIDTLKPEAEAFSFYDLHISEYEQYILNQIN